jgi:hypothetical protein
VAAAGKGVEGGLMWHVDCQVSAHAHVNVLVDDKMSLIRTSARLTDGWAV